MAELESDRSSFEQRCQGAVDRLITRHQSQILPRDVFVQRTWERLQQADVADPYKAATGVYSLALYAACSGEEGAERQELGYGELHRYLYDAAAWRYPDVCDDATQAALLHIFEDFARCRHPIAFLLFALHHLANAARSFRRQAGSQAHVLDAAIRDSEYTLANLLVDPNQPDPIMIVIEDEGRSELRQLVDEFRRAYPRASKQIAALLMKYLRGMDDVMISQALNTPVKSVHELRSRARRKLRADARWRSLAITFGLLPEEAHK